MKAPACISLLVSAVTGPAAAATLTLGLDLSGSNPLLSSPAFAREAASHAAGRAAALELGDTVVVRSFGARGGANIASRSARITRSYRAGKAADAVRRLIAGIPESGVQPQTRTNIAAFLEFGDFDCANGGEILLITDGIEASAYADETAFLEGKAPLPEPEPGLLSGCRITFFGLGGGRAPQTVKTIRDAWRTWFEKAGAEFDAVIF